MTEAVSGLLKITFGLLANKARRKIAERLKDGDVTDEECQRLIVRELDDIKTKLDGLASKDLLSSVCFLQEGINRLYQSVQQFKSSVSGPPIKEAVALISSIKIGSNERFKSAIESFKLAREKATEAFCNEALSIEDRIQASQVRMMASIMENLEDPDAAISDCLQYLKQLHDGGAIQEIVSVLIRGGIASWINEAKRLEIASSVYLMNRMLFDFAKKFAKSPPAILDWPTILLQEVRYHPLLGDGRLFKKLKSSGVQVIAPGLDITFGRLNEVNQSTSVLNSKGEILVKMFRVNTIKVFKSSEESRTFCSIPREANALNCKAAAMDIDAKDNLYVITSFSRSFDDPSRAFILRIFDKNGNKKFQAPLTFFGIASFFRGPLMTVSQDEQIGILDSAQNILHIGKIRPGRSTEVTFDKSYHLKALSDVRCTKIQFSNYFGRNIIAADDKDTVYIYTENGLLQRRIKLPNGYGKIYSFAINHKTKRILVNTCVSPAYALYSVSITDEVIDCLCLGSSPWMNYAKLTSNPNGAVALINSEGAVFLSPS